MKRQEIKTIAREIDRFLNNKDFEAKYKTTQKIVASPIEITFIPALGAFRYPPTNYDDNLQLRDITGYPLDQEEFIHTFERIIGKKGVSESAADILIVFQGTVGIVDLDRELLAQVEDRLTKALNYQGLYIVDIIPFVSDYWVNIVTVREHPVFKKNSA